MNGTHYTTYNMVNSRLHQLYVDNITEQCLIETKDMKVLILIYQFVLKRIEIIFYCTKYYTFLSENT